MRRTLQGDGCLRVTITATKTRAISRCFSLAAMAELPFSFVYTAHEQLGAKLRLAIELVIARNLANEEYYARTLFEANSGACGGVPGRPGYAYFGFRYEL